MKIFFILFMSFPIVEAIAQKWVSFHGGPKFGAVFPMAPVADLELQQPREEPDVYPSDFVPFYAGGMFDLWIGRHLSVQLEALYAQSGFQNSKYTTKFGYFQVPLILKLKAGAFSIHGGYQFDFLTSAKYKTTSNGWSDAKELYDKQAKSLVCGMELQGKRGLTFTLRYVYGLTNIPVATEDGVLYNDYDMIYNSQAQIGFGFAFGKKRMSSSEWKARKFRRDQMDNNL